MASSFQQQKLLIANRGEIAVRVLRTAKRLHISTVAVYTHSDATSPHVLLADEAVALRPDDADPVSNSRGYLDAEAIVDICKERGVTLVHPGYGFLSENTHFANLLRDAGITFLGPRPETIEAMGLKHEAKAIAVEAGVPLVPGSDGLLATEEEAVSVAAKIGYPIMLKSTAGGGGMGLVICRSVDELRARLHSTRERATVSSYNHFRIQGDQYRGICRRYSSMTVSSWNGTSLTHGMLRFRYAISICCARLLNSTSQVFGNGLGHAIHLGERECSVQRRHQKVIEESPSPFMLKHPGELGNWTKSDKCSSPLTVVVFRGLREDELGCPASLPAYQVRVGWYVSLQCAFHISADSWQAPWSFSWMIKRRSSSSLK